MRLFEFPPLSSSELHTNSSPVTNSTLFPLSSGFFVMRATGGRNNFLTGVSNTSVLLLDSSLFEGSVMAMPPQEKRINFRFLYKNK